MVLPAIGALSAHSTTQASSISNTALAQHKHAVHNAKSTFATPASNALGNNATKTDGLSKDFLSVLSNMKA